MPEPDDDLLREPVRGTLHDLHAAQPIPSFNETWSAAYETVEREARVARHRGLARWAIAAAVVAALGAGLLWLVPPVEPGGETGLASPTAATPEERFAELPPSFTDPASPGVGEPTPQVIWYAPTDELLRVGLLRHSAMPAALTVYDPIQLEVRP